MTAAPRAGWLRAGRRRLAGVIAAAVAAFPAIEPLFVRAGRAGSRRSRLLAGLYWFIQESLIARLRRRGERFRVVQLFDWRLQLDITDESGRLPYFYRTPFKAGVCDAIVTALRSGDVFLDLGAGIGYFSVLAARVVGARGRVLALESDESRRDALETLVQRNEAADRVEVPGDAAAALPAIDVWLAATPALAARIRCVRMDAAGDEARLLAGMRTLLAAPHLTIVCATTAGGAADVALVRAGFQRRRIEPGVSPSADFLYVRP
jgi:hypothetical protein